MRISKLSCMEKARINLDIVLPEVTDEKDECVNRVIKSLENKRGIDKVHVISGEEGKKAQLCFHYNPSIVSISKVEEWAKTEGLAITKKYSHLLIEVRSIRHQRHARSIEDSLRKNKGLQSVSVSA